MQAVNHIAADTFREEKKKKKKESFFPLNFNVYINLDNRERARKKNKWQRRPISLEEKHENYIATVRKWEMVAATKMKMSGSGKQGEQEHKHFLHKTRK